MGGASPSDGFEFLSGGGEMGERIRAFDWAATPLGPPEGWPPALRCALAICLGSSVPTAIYWGPDFRLLYNDAWSRVPADRHPWALGRPAVEVWHDIWEVIEPQLAEVVALGRGLAFYDRHLPMEREGAVRETYWNYSFSPLRGEDGGILGVFNQGHETTARVLHERRREAEAQRQRRLFEQAPGFITVLRGPDHRFEFVNDAYRRVFGDRDYIGRTAREVFPELEGQDIVEILDRVYASGERFVARDMPVRIVRDNLGEEELYIDYIYEPILDEHGNVAGLFCEGADSTQSHRALRELREKGFALETLNGILGAPIVEGNRESIARQVVDAGVKLTGARTGTVVYNFTERDGERRTLRLSSGAARTAFDDIPAALAEALFASVLDGRQLVRSSDIAADPRYAGHAPSAGAGQVRSFLAAPVILHEGEVVGGMFFGHDRPGMFEDRHEQRIALLAAQTAIVIENHRLVRRVREDNETLEERVAERTRELSEAHEALRHAQKMEAVGQLTGGIAHDFNNLLAAIGGSLEVLDRRIRDGVTDGLDRYIAGARQSADRAAALTQRLLAFSRRQTLDPKPTDIGALVAGLEDMIVQSVGPAVAVSVVGREGPWVARVDSGQLENALLNLAVNARDAMPDGGSLTLEIACEPLAGERAARNDLPAGDYVVVTVSDTGVGIPADAVDRIFDPFFTTKPLGEGTGLGLSMVHGFVRQSGGQVEVDSAPDRGTAMRLFLPLAGGLPAASRPAAGSAAPPADSIGNRTVLVVDDEVIVRMLMVEELEEAGYRVIEAHDGASALRMLDDAGGKVDLLVTDVGLPGGMNGRQLADAVRAILPGLGVLFVTGYADTRVVAENEPAGAMHVLAKPFTAADLRRRVAELLAGGRV